MRVSVVQLRRDGKKLSPEEVAAAEPFTGVLAFNGYRLMGESATCYEVTLRGGDSPGSMDRIKPLHRAKLCSIKGPNMMFAGVEVHPIQGLPPAHIRQAWWVRLLDQ